MEAGPTSASRREFASVAGSIASARDFVGEALADGVLDPAKIGDIQLAVSELVTNAVGHGNGEPITVGLGTSSGTVVCSVTSGANDPELPVPTAWALPVEGEPTGRGLAIVRAVSDAVEVRIAGSSVTVLCTFEPR